HGRRGGQVRRRFGNAVPGSLLWTLLRFADRAESGPDGTALRREDEWRLCPMWQLASWRQLPCGPALRNDGYAIPTEWGLVRRQGDPHAGYGQRHLRL